MKTHSTGTFPFAADEAPPDPCNFVLEGDSLGSLEHSSALEWLETNGVGGFASGTVSTCPTRRYHGLLVGPTERFVERHVFVSRFEETLERNGERFSLSVARYGEQLFAPEEFRAPARFTQSPWPTWEYALPGARVRREILSVRGRSITLCRWSLLHASAEAEFELSLRPLLPFRAADALTVQNDVFDTKVTPTLSGVSCRPYNALPALYLESNCELTRLDQETAWFRGLWFERDRVRGYDFQEDQCSPAAMRYRISLSEPVVVAISLGQPVRFPAALWECEAEQRTYKGEGLHAGVRGRCEVSADDFLYQSTTPSGEDRPGVIAGFPWFLEWGRDTFLSLPGLTLARGRVDDCAEALSGVLEYLDGGLIPNIFGSDITGSHYGSVDAALWFARCVRLFERNGGTRRFVIENYRSSLVEIADAYFAGTGLGVEIDQGGLLRAGDETTNATWMDARTPDGPVTPRAGFAVEIQALWVHLLAHLEDLFKDSGLRREKRRFSQAHAKACATFLERFWLPEERRLADVWTENQGADKSIRPNMVLAAALEFSPLDQRQRADIVACAERELLTPRGLRTLARSDPAYRGHYGGGTRERDEAYHQGTVWPWLLGYFVEASLRADKTSLRELAFLRSLWDDFSSELMTRGIGHISEVFSGEAPHTGGGTIAQAWNTAECLRSYAMLEKGRA